MQQVQSRRANDTFRNYANAFTYTAAGAVSAMRLGNGLWEKTEFNSRLQTTQIGLGTGSAVQNRLRLDYTYGEMQSNGTIDATRNNGNLARQTITVPTVITGGTTHTGFTAVQSYQYDSLNRLKSAVENVQSLNSSNQPVGSQSLSWRQTFTFDRYGNRNFDEAQTTTLPKNCGTPPNQTVCPEDVARLNPSVNPTNNRLSSPGWQYDAAGNTLQDAEGRSFIYDGENKQTEVRNAQNQVIGRYYFDGDGKRVKKVVPSTGETTVFVYDASGKLVAEYSTIVEPVSTAKTSYLTQDHLGSPRILTDQTGAVISRRDFLPFGEEIQRTSYGVDTVRQKFTGYERDAETDLDFAQARMYHKNHGRFTTVDPFNLILEKQSEDDRSRASRLFLRELTKTQNWNRYLYALGNPLLYADPLGEDALVVAFTDYKIAVFGSSGKNGRVPYLGHAGIVIIDEDGTTTYYEYGRYDEEGRGIVRKFTDLPKLKFTSDGVATEESVKELMKALSKRFGQGGSVEGAYFNTNQETTDYMKKFADKKYAENDIPDRTSYSLTENNCMTFTRDVLKGDGVILDTNGSSPRPNADIILIQNGKYKIPDEHRYEEAYWTNVGRIPYKPNKK